MLQAGMGGVLVKLVEQLGNPIIAECFNPAQSGRGVGRIKPTM
jgi:hypothetical protein